MCPPRSRGSSASRSFDGTNEGLAVARAHVQRLGQPLAMNGRTDPPGPRMLVHPDESVSSIARLLDVSRSTVYKYMPGLGKGRSQLTAGEDRPLPDVSEYDALMPSRWAIEA